MKSNKFERLLSALASLAFLFFVLPIFFLLLPYKIITLKAQVNTFQIDVIMDFFPELATFRFIGIVPILVGIVSYIWCTWSFTFSGRGTPVFGFPTEELVVSGLYRFVRNPIYVGACLILFGEALLFASAGLLIYASAWFIFFNFVVHGEEASLRRKYGESYEQYCKSVHRWIPRLKPFRGYMSKPS
jgi:protein-S-isoprenylcysteine O-methyltransferase Ste14